MLAARLVRIGAHRTTKSHLGRLCEELASTRAGVVA